MQRLLEGAEVMVSAYEKSEALANSPMQRFTSKIHKFCTKHRLPRVHGCIWDRHCRWCGAPRRVALFWGRHDWWVDLPGYDKAATSYRKQDGRWEVAERIPASWQLLPQFGGFSRPKDEPADE